MADTNSMTRCGLSTIAFRKSAKAPSRSSLQDRCGDRRDSESDHFRTFLRNIVENATNRILERIVWDEFSGPIRVLLMNAYVFRPFWRAVWGLEPDGAWRQRFAARKRAAASALVRRDIFTVLGVVFDRLYTLRNQVFHCGATWLANAARCRNARRPACYSCVRSIRCG